MPEYAPTLNFTSNIITVLIDNSEAKETWNFAGWIAQKIELPFGPNANSLVSFRRLWLRQKQLLIFPKVTATYKIWVKFPKWFTQASITVWEYQGLLDETIAIQLSQVEAKLDTLLQQHPP